MHESHILGSGTIFPLSGPALGSDGPQFVRLAERGFQHKAQEQQMLQLSKQTHWMWAKNLLLYC